MRAGDPGWEISKEGTAGSWKINIEPGQAWKQRGAWGTPFSCFRFAIPEACKFEGRAVYMDADMLVRADVKELLEWPIPDGAGYVAIDKVRTDVSVIDCSYFNGKPWWPSVDFMRKSGWCGPEYRQLLIQNKAISPTLARNWNAFDPMQPCPDPGYEHCKLLHYTVVPTQPYKPYPSVNYFKHPWQSWVDIWNEHLEEARAASA